MSQNALSRAEIVDCGNANTINEPKAIVGSPDEKYPGAIHGLLIT
jgi:hypothetical protein